MTTAASPDTSALLKLLDSDTGELDLITFLLKPAERRLLRRCALPRRFNQSLVDEVLRPDAGVDEEALPFARVCSLPGVRADPGRSGWYRMDAEDRAQHELAWLGQARAESDDLITEAGFVALNRRLAGWFAALGAQGELERAYHALAAGLEDAKGLVLPLYRQAEQSFDLARCESLLDVLDQRARFLDGELASFRTDARGLLRARSIAADDFYRTGRYLQRPPLLAAFESLLPAGAPFILHLHGPGGHGKTMFLRWLGARYCLPRQIPIARVDFDFLDESEAGLEPRFFFGKLAERLNPQLPGAPFDELLGDVREMRRTASASRGSGRGGAGSSARAREEQEITTRFAHLLEEHCRGPVVLVFDTLEDARFKHRVDIRAVIDAVAAVRTTIAATSAARGRTPPRLLLVLSGRYTLARQYPDVHAAYATCTVPCEVGPFDHAESLAYLQSNRGLPPSPILNAVAERAEGNPFKLALFADVLMANPSLTREDLERHVDIDLLYLIERVLKRIPDYPLRWVLRYGVVARRLTRRFLEEVLARHLERGMRGHRGYDDPGVDHVQDEGWPLLWYALDAASRTQSPDYAALWNKLQAYAGESSWITDAPGMPDTLSIQPVVTRPMRRALLGKPVVRWIHRDAVRVLRRRVDAREAPLAEHLAALTFHEFQHLGPRAARGWRRRLSEHASDPEALRALASVVLSDDLGESGTDLVSADVQARAYFVLAELAYRASREAVGEEQQRREDEARTHLADFEACSAAARVRPVALAPEAMLRWELARDEASRQRAIRQLEAAEQTRLAPVDRTGLLRALRTAYAQVDPQRALGYARKAMRLARRQRDAAAFGETARTTARDLASRGLAAAAQRELRAAEAALADTGAGWISPEEARRELRRVKLLLAQLLEACGFASLALEEVSFSRRELQDATKHERAERHLTRSRLLLVTRDPEAALRAARDAARTLEPFRRGKRSSAAEHRLQLQVIDCMTAEAHALRHLMEFGPALDLFQAALSHAAPLGQPGYEVGLRLAKAQVYLHYVGDLRQAESHIDDRDDAYADDAPWVQLQHALLRASLRDLKGRSQDAERALDQGARLAAGFDWARGRHAAACALAGLALRHSESRVRHLESLREALAQLDDPAARLALLPALRHCYSVSGAPAPLAGELEALTRFSPATPRRGEVPEADRLHLALLRVELLRVLELRGQAKSELTRLATAIAKRENPLLHRELAAACDRLGVRHDALLPEGWLDALVLRFRNHPVLCGVAMLEEAEREFKRGSSGRARELVVRSGRRLARKGAVPSLFDARLLELSAEISREARDRTGASAVHARAARLREELGHPPAGTERPALAGARRDAWIAQLGGRDTFVVRMESESQATLLSAASGTNEVDETALKLPGALTALLSSVGEGPLSGSASLPLIQQLHGSWTQLGALMAHSLLPGSLREAVRFRLGRGADGRAPQESGDEPQSPELDLVLEAERAVFHALPWELAVLDADAPRLVVREPGLRYLSRGPYGFSLRRRATWVQNAINQLTGARLAADGIAGPATSRAVAEFQSAVGLEDTGRADLRTRVRLREELRDAGSALREPPSVLLVESEQRQQIAMQRGHSSRGTNLAELYRRHGMSVERLDEPSPDLLRNLLAKRPFYAVHVSAPVAESRTSRELSLQLGAGSTTSRNVTSFSSTLLARTLAASSWGPSPLVILDVPRPPSLDEAFRQLVLRNVFAAHLFALGRLPVVLATGLAAPEHQRQLSNRLIAGLARRSSPGELARSLQRAVLRLTAPAHPVEAHLGTTCTALFAHDPELHPSDLFAAEFR